MSGKSERLVGLGRAHVPSWFVADDPELLWHADGLHPGHVADYTPCQNIYETSVMTGVPPDLSMIVAQGHIAQHTDHLGDRTVSYLLVLKGAEHAEVFARGPRLPAPTGALFRLDHNFMHGLRQRRRDQWIAVALVDTNRSLTATDVAERFGTSLMKG